MPCKILELEGTDSNRRTQKREVLQTSGFNHSPTFQFDLRSIPDSNRGHLIDSEAW